MPPRAFARNWNRARLPQIAQSNCVTIHGGDIGGWAVAIGNHILSQDSMDATRLAFVDSDHADAIGEGSQGFIRMRVLHQRIPQIELTLSVRYRGNAVTAPADARSSIAAATCMIRSSAILSNPCQSSAMLIRVNAGPHNRFVCYRRRVVSNASSTGIQIIRVIETK